MTLSRRQKRTLGMISLACAWLCFVPASGVAAGSCRNDVVHDYLAPFRALPRVRPVPYFSDLPFGPPHFRLGGTGDYPVLVGPSVEGFQVEYQGDHSVPRLDWSIEARLVRFRDGGRQSRIVERRRAHIVVAFKREQRGFEFKIPAKPSLYRLEIEFRDSRDRRLGLFGDQFRMMRPRLDTRLSLSGAEFTSGETIESCFENFGTETMHEGDSFEIQVLGPAGWERSSISPTGTVASIGKQVFPGLTQSSRPFTIPEKAPPGTYRWVVLNSRLGSGAPYPVAPPEFRISGSGG